MATFFNSDVHARVWPWLRTADGRTVGLAPGEEVEMDAPDDFVDPYLLPVIKGKRGRAVAPASPESDEETEL